MSLSHTTDWPVVSQNHHITVHNTNWILLKEFGIYFSFNFTKRKKNQPPTWKALWISFGFVLVRLFSENRSGTCSLLPKSIRIRCQIRMAVIHAMLSSCTWHTATWIACNFGLWARKVFHGTTMTLSAFSIFHRCSVVQAVQGTVVKWIIVVSKCKGAWLEATL